MLSKISSKWALAVSSAPPATDTLEIRSGWRRMVAIKVPEECHLCTCFDAQQSLRKITRRFSLWMLLFCSFFQKSDWEGFNQKASRQRMFCSFLVPGQSLDVGFALCMHRVTIQHRQCNASAQNIMSLVRAKGSWEAGKMNFVCFVGSEGRRWGWGHGWMDISCWILVTLHVWAGHGSVRSFIKNKISRYPVQTSKPKGLISVCGKEEYSLIQEIEESNLSYNYEWEYRFGSNLVCASFPHFQAVVSSVSTENQGWHKVSFLVSVWSQSGLGWKGP